MIGLYLFFFSFSLLVGTFGFMGQGNWQGNGCCSKKGKDKKKKKRKKYIKMGK